ncbi:hypothetical protein [Candidatus Hamiltonella defensa]|uniref:hypothetical protein n=1 Tax=Candidatus Williamhamiltonella defendens TaxID=138072 RepID=UPI0030D85F12
MLDLVDELEQHNLTKVFTTLQLIELQYSELVLEADVILAREVFPVTTLRRKGIQLLTNVS